MISAVFDSTTLLQAATKRTGPAGACLAFVETGQVKLFLSPVTLDEIRDVLQRPPIRRAFPRLTDESVQEFLNLLLDKGHLVPDVPHVYSFERDPDDEPFLDLAIATQASFIVTRDKDLLDLMKDKGFRAACPEITILDPVAFLQHLRAETTKEASGE